MELINSLAENYADRYTSSSDPLLDEVINSTMSTHPHAHMMSSRVQGKFLELFSTLLKPARILEIGTFTGFSALCMAKGIQPGGKLHTIELKEEDGQTAAENFKRSKYNEQIILHIGNALNIIPLLDETWDLVFIDADKTGYIEYYNLVLPRLRQGGVIIADNVLFHGQVLEQPIKGKSAKAIDMFNEYVRNDQRVEQVVLTMRDGLMLIVKK